MHDFQVNMGMLFVFIMYFLCLAVTVSHFCYQIVITQYKNRVDTMLVSAYITTGSIITSCYCQVYSIFILMIALIRDL
jgi:hypothetical protein